MVRHRLLVRADGGCLALAGALVASVPFVLRASPPLVGWPVSLFGATVGVLLCASGLVAVALPRAGIVVGVAGLLLSLLSLVGALGGLLVGAAVGVVGGSLCLWGGRVHQAAVDSRRRHRRWVRRP
ncbi:MAG: DUF6114 domain-containing protein [Haloarculaceae archaeon]